ncbi:MAG TPA: single-stranded DNA-binding protein [Bacilli bacterium]|nr:single-stranded DNA-binding protein [Bacilli bacterium]
MLNQIVLVGRIARDIEIKDTENGKKVSNMTLAVPRSFKNIEGEYETDFLPCVLWDGIATNVNEYCKVGDLVGVKGRVASNVYEKDGQKHYSVEIIVEKVTFLTSNKSKEKEAE